MAKRVTTNKRQRRERGSINPDDILTGAWPSSWGSTT